MANETIAIDSLDLDIEDLADLKGFEAMPAGDHRVTISFVQKEVNNVMNVEMTMAVVESVQLAEGATAPNPGTEFSVLFNLDKELGQGKLKEILKVLAGKFGVMKAGPLMAAASGSQVLVHSKPRPDREDKTKFYTNITTLVFED